MGRLITGLFAATIACIIANLFIAIADYGKAEFVMKNSSEVHVPAAALPYLASLKVGAVVGLVLGMTVAPWIGVAAGVGLTIFYVGAIVFHVRARVFYNIAFPGVFLVLAVASAAYSVRLAVGA